ncbi:DUF2231 domain-containing protein [Aestuariivivens sediminicola]|uniref:DUF2231 domain-containing protein n=1 Tax=Aestuariivivens sediminicola TaxID=2913560 RepID=UPI001F575F0D|nr:DUF2231 domain-containing protein [Aestuariivivens sediminicola]
MDWNLFFGRFHPLIVHLPIGIFILGYGFEILFQLGYRNIVNSRKVILLIYSIGLLSGFMAAVTGWLLSFSNDYGIEPLNDHRNLGIVTLLVMLAVIIYQLKAPEAKARLKFGFSTIAILLTALTGHFGGTLTHGASYLVEYGPEFLKSEDDLGVSVINEMHPDSVHIYTHIIQPILDNKCTTCHNAKHNRGGLILEGYNNLFQESDHHRPISAGNLHTSELYTRVTLPVNHEKVMPPSGAGLGYTEIQILKYWIENGADSLAVFHTETMTQELIALMNRDYDLDYSPKPYYDRINVEKPDESLLESLRNSGFRVNYLGKTNYLLDVGFKNDALSIENIELLNKISDHVTILQLMNCNLTDDFLEVMVPMKHLTRIDLSKNKQLGHVTAFLAKHQHLESVNLNETSITHNSLQNLLRGFDDLRVYVRKTKVTQEEQDALRQAFSRAEIVSEFSFEKVEQAKSVFRSELEN